MVSQTPEPVSPLGYLSMRLQSWPPSVSGLANILGQCEAYMEFAGIVRQFLPEHQAEILGHPLMEDQAASFATRFEERYFPLCRSLSDGMVEEYEQITMGIPVEVHGISYECYYDMSYLRPGLLLMTALIDVPSEGRIPLMEECRKHLPVELLETCPQLSIGQLEELLTDTRFEGLIRWARIWDHSTGLYFLDAVDEDGWEQIDWSEDNVAALKADWDQSLEFEEPAYKLAEWIEEEPEAHMREIISFIEGRQKDEH